MQYSGTELGFFSLYFFFFGIKHEEIVIEFDSDNLNNITPNTHFFLGFLLCRSSSRVSISRVYKSAILGRSKWLNHRRRHRHWYEWSEWVCMRLCWSTQVRNTTSGRTFIRSQHSDYLYESSKSVTLKPRAQTHFNFFVSCTAKVRKRNSCEKKVSSHPTGAFYIRFFFLFIIIIGC